MMIAPSSSTAGELARRPTPGAGHGGVSIIRVRMFDGSGARWGCDQRLNGLANAGELWSNVSIRRRPPVVLFDFVADLGPWN